MSTTKKNPTVIDVNDSTETTEAVEAKAPVMSRIKHRTIVVTATTGKALLATEQTLVGGVVLAGEGVVTGTKAIGRGAKKVGQHGLKSAEVTEARTGTAIARVVVSRQAHKAKKAEAKLAKAEAEVANATK